MMKIYASSLFSTKQEFLRYVAIYNSYYRAASASQNLYLSMMTMNDQAKDYSALLRNSSYISLAYDTLREWNMDQRGAKLVPLSGFRTSILSHVQSIAQLKRYRLELLTDSEAAKVLSELESLFVGLSVMATQARIVGVSKTLHFLLPNLVMPIDRRNILSLLYLSNEYSSDPRREFRTFTEIFQDYRALCHKLALSAGDVDRVGWNTSIPKMIDNAVIGFVDQLLKGNVKFSFASAQPTKKRDTSGNR